MRTRARCGSPRRSCASSATRSPRWRSASRRRPRRSRATTRTSIVVVYQDDGHALDLIEEITEFARGPVIAIVEKEDPEFVSEAAKRGIYAYAREGQTESIQSGDRGRDAPPRASSGAGRAGRAPRVRARAPGAHRAGEGHPHGAPRIAEREAFDRLRDHARSRNRTVVTSPHRRRGARAAAEGARLGTAGSRPGRNQ